MSENHSHELAETLAVRTATATAEGIRIVRIMPAPPALVFEAWTTPQHFSQWFGEYDSQMPVETVSMDVRVGGAWSSIMFHGPDRIEIPFAGRYVEIDPPTHLVQTLADPGGSGHEEVFTIDLTDLGDGTTEMVFTQTGGNLPAEQYRQAMAGSLIFFERMAAHLSALQV